MSLLKERLLVLRICLPGLLTRHDPIFHEVFLIFHQIGSRSLAEADPEIHKLVEREKHRQVEGIELIASEVGHLVHANSSIQLV